MSALHDAKMRFSRAQLGVWKAKLRREAAKWAEKDRLVEMLKAYGEEAKAAAAEAGAGLERTKALDNLPRAIDAEVEEAADELLRFDVRPDDVEEINKTIQQGDEDNDDE